jgi:hypothetical protein
MGYLRIVPLVDASVLDDQVRELLRRLDEAGRSAPSGNAADEMAP